MASCSYDDSRTVIESITRIAHARALDDVATRACEELRALVHSPCVTVALVDGTVLRVVGRSSCAQWPPGAAGSRVHASALAVAALTERRIRAVDCPSDVQDLAPITGGIWHTDITGVSVCPLIADGTPLGLIYVGDGPGSSSRSRIGSITEEFARRFAPLLEAAQSAELDWVGAPTAVRELHDTALQLIFSIHLASTRLRARLPYLSDDHAVAARIVADASSAMECLRTSAALLNEPDPQDTLAVQLRSTTDTATSLFPFQVQLLEYGVMSATTTEQDRLACRIVEEGLRNVAQHSSARSVLVMITYTDCTLEVSVSDDGRGAADYAAVLDSADDDRGTSLRALRNSLLDADGSLDAFPNEDGGFLLRGALSLGLG